MYVPQRNEYLVNLGRHKDKVQIFLEGHKNWKQKFTNVKKNGILKKLCGLLRIFEL